MTTPADPLRVAVGILRRTSGEVLVAERDAGRHQGGGLEFPGGKCEPGETTAAALARELDEELGIAVTASSPLIRVRHDYAERAVELDAVLVTDWRGEPRGAEGQPLHWLAPQTLSPARFPAANRPILAALTRPARCLVTPDIDRLADASSLLAVLDRALGEQGVGLVQLRRRHRGTAAWRDLVVATAGRCREYGAHLLVNAGPDDIGSLPPGAGLHLRAGFLPTLTQRPVPDDVCLSCACHDRDELARAEALGADIAFVGPVQATPTHPGATPLGWDGLARLAARTTLPLYALGGVVPGDIARARASGAVGVAGIRGFLPADLE